MKDMVKKYIPYAAVMFIVFMFVPLVFLSDTMSRFFAIAYYFIFPATTIICSTIYCSKYGLDFLFALIAPILYLPSMLIYNGGFSSQYTLTNLLLLAVYLVAGIFGLFLGDVAFGDNRRKMEEQEKAEAEEMLLEAKRRDETELEKITLRRERRPEKGSQRQPEKKKAAYDDYDDDFDYNKYLSDIDRKPITSSESEIDDILSEFGSSGKY